MAVYVDPMTDRLPTPGFNWPRSCRLFADSTAELLAFAEKIGLRRGWVVATRPELVHFLITGAKRAAAVEMGAQEVEFHFVDDFIESRRAGISVRAERETAVPHAERGGTQVQGGLFGPRRMV
ncbi:MAG: DUF4031 domain-containing protein [Phycisphaerales bacterium]|nr:DUF4031 domain-containing protein [Phycisphaerales bacterium]